MVTQALPEVSDRSIADSELTKKIVNYYEKGNYGLLAPAEKKTFGGIYINLTARSPEIQNIAFSSLIEKVTYRSDPTTSLWQTLVYDQTISTIFGQVDQQAKSGTSISVEQAKFITEVAGRASASGN